MSKVSENLTHQNSPKIKFFHSIWRIGAENSILLPSNPSNNDSNPHISMDDVKLIDNYVSNINLNV